MSEALTSNDSEDPRYSATIVKKLNSILMSSAELVELRDRLRTDLSQVQDDTPQEAAKKRRRNFLIILIRRTLKGCRQEHFEGFWREAYCYTFKRKIKLVFKNYFEIKIFKANSFISCILLAV